MRFITLEKISYYGGVPLGKVIVNIEKLCFMESMTHKVKADFRVHGGLNAGEECKYTVLTFPGGGGEENGVVLTVKETIQQIQAMINQELADK